MSKQSIMVQVNDAASMAQYHLDLYVETHQVKHLEKYTFWGRAMAFWVSALSEGE